MGRPAAKEVTASKTKRFVAFSDPARFGSPTPHVYRVALSLSLSFSRSFSNFLSMSQVYCVGSSCCTVSVSLSAGSPTRPKNPINSITSSLL